MLDKKQMEADLKEVFARCIKKNDPAVQRIKKYFSESCQLFGKVPVQQRKGKICPDCDNGTEFVICNHGKRGIPCCRCEGTGRLSPVA